MRKTHIAGGAIALALAALTGGAALAQQAAAPAQSDPARHARGDADADGRISQAEFVQARVTRLSTMDNDRDGAVTAEETRAAMQARRAERAAMRFDRLDADKNGSISRAEFDGAREHRGGHAGARRGARPTAHRKGAREPVVIADVQTRAAETFARMDADHDGYLTRDERRAAQRQMHQRRAERTARRQNQTQASPSAPASE